MTVIVKHKTTFGTVQYDDVSNIAYSAGTYTITYGNAQTASVNASDWLIAIMFK